MDANPYDSPGTEEPRGDGGASARPTKVRWMVFALACTTSWMLYLHRYSWGVIKSDIQTEFGMTNEQLGWLDAARSLAYAAMQIPSGLAGDVSGPALVLPVIIAAWSLVLGGMMFGVGYRSFLLIHVLFGATQAGAYPNLNKASRSWFPLSVRTTMQGFIASFAGRVGGACAALIVGTLLMGRLGLKWRAAMLCLTAGGIVFAVVFRLLFRNSPAEHPWSNEAERQLVEEGESTPAAGAKVALRFSPMVLLSFSFLLLHMFFSAAADQLYPNWIPLFLEQEKGLSKTAMGIFASLPLWGGALGGMTAGILNDVLIRRLGSRRWARRLVGMSGKLIAAGLVLVSINIESAYSMMAVLGVAKFFTDWSQPTVWGTVTDISGPAAGRIFGTVNMVGSLGGSVIAPIFGRMLDHIGWNAVFFSVAGMYLAAGLTWLVIDPTKRLVAEKAESS